MDHGKDNKNNKSNGAGSRDMPWIGPSCSGNSRSTGKHWEGWEALGSTRKAQEDPERAGNMEFCLEMQ